MDIANFGKARIEWFKQFLELPNGVPSHDTFGRVFSLLNAPAFEACFFDWVKAIKENQGHLYEDIAHLFELYLKESNPLQFVDGYAKTVDKDHGRIEIRECWTLSATFHQQAIRNAREWAKLTSLVCIRREQRLPEKT